MMQRLSKNLVKITKNQNNFRNIQRQQNLINLQKNVYGFTSINEPVSNSEQEFQSMQKRIKLVFISAALGGAFVGFGLYSLFNPQPCDKEDKKIQNKNNLYNFKGQWNQNWDNRQYLQDEEDQLKQLKKQNPDDKEIQNKPIRQRGIKHITMIRHGQYIYADDEEGKKLTQLGRKQAEQTGKRIKELGLKFDKIYVSDMVRSKETCEIIKKYAQLDVPVIEDPSLAEGYPCNVSPKNKNLEKYFQSDNEKKEDQIRIEGAFEKYFHRIEDQEEDSHELYVIHANVIRYLMTRALQFNAEGWLRFHTAHCGITSLKIRPNGNVSMRQFGESGHLKKEQTTMF